MYFQLEAENNYAMGLASVIYNGVQAPLKFDSPVLRFSHPVRPPKLTALYFFHSSCHGHTLCSGLSLLIFFFILFNLYEPNVQSELFNLTPNFEFAVGRNRRGRYSPITVCSKGTEQEHDLSTSGGFLLCE